MAQELESRIISKDVGLITVVANTINSGLNTNILSLTGALYQTQGIRKLIINLDGVKDKPSAYKTASFLQDIIRTDVYPITYVGVSLQEEEGRRPDKRVLRNSYDTLDAAVASYNK